MVCPNFFCCHDSSGCCIILSIFNLIDLLLTLVCQQHLQFHTFPSQKLKNVSDVVQSTLDPLLAIEALICGTIVSSILRRISRPRFLRRLYKNLARKARKSHRISEILDASPSEDPYNEYIQIESPESSKFLWPRSKRFTLNKCSSPIQGLSKTPPRQLTDSDTYFSTFHKTPDRVNLSKDEYEKLTRDCTKKALEELVSSPDFNKWAAANAERITLTPKSDAGSTAGKQRGWLSWF